MESAVSARFEEDRWVCLGHVDRGELERRVVGGARKGREQSKGWTGLLFKHLIIRVYHLSGGLYWFWPKRRGCFTLKFKPIIVIIYYYHQRRYSCLFRLEGVACPRLNCNKLTRNGWRRVVRKKLKKIEEVALLDETKEEKKMSRN